MIKEAENKNNKLKLLGIKLYIIAKKYILYFNKKKVEQAGIDPAASCMLSKRSTI